MDANQLARMGAAVEKSLGAATDDQLDEVAGLIMQQALSIRAMKNLPPAERMKLASLYTDLRQKSDVLWVALMGLGIRAVATPEGAVRGMGYITETGEPLDMAFGMQPLARTKKE